MGTTRGVGGGRSKSDGNHQYNEWEGKKLSRCEKKKKSSKTIRRGKGKSQYCIYPAGRMCREKKGVCGDGPNEGVKEIGTEPAI